MSRFPNRVAFHSRMNWFQFKNVRHFLAILLNISELWNQKPSGLFWMGIRKHTSFDIPPCVHTLNVWCPLRNYSSLSVCLYFTGASLVSPAGSGPSSPFSLKDFQANFFQYDIIVPPLPVCLVSPASCLSVDSVNLTLHLAVLGGRSAHVPFALIGSSASARVLYGWWTWVTQGVGISFLCHVVTLAQLHSRTRRLPIIEFDFQWRIRIKWYQLDWLLIKSLDVSLDLSPIGRAVK